MTDRPVAQARPNEFPALPKVVIRSRHPDAFQSGQWAMVDGVRWVKGRACYHVRFVDGAHDYWPVLDPMADYEFKTARPHGEAA